MGRFSDQGFANCEIPLLGGTLIDFNLPGIPGIGDILAKLANLIQELLAPLLDCINECYFDGDQVIDLLALIKLSGIDLSDIAPDIGLEEFLEEHIDKFNEWLNRPGIGAMINSLLGVYIGPINDFLDFICSLLNLFKCLFDPENLVRLAGGDTDWVAECIEIDIPWPFPCDWLEYFIGEFTFNMPCVENPFPDGVSIEMPKLKIDAGCLISKLIPGLGSGLNDIWNALAVGVPFEMCAGIKFCEPLGGKIVDFGDISLDWLIQILGMLIQLPFTLLDKLLSFGFCIFKDLLEFIENGIEIGAESIGLDFDSILGDILLTLNSLQIVNIDLDEYETAFDAWINELEVALPWFCVVRCLIGKLVADFIEPIINLITGLLNALAQAINQALGALGAAAQLLRALLDILKGLGFLLDDYCINFAELLQIPEDCILET